MHQEYKALVIISWMVMVIILTILFLENRKCDVCVQHHKPAECVDICK